MNLIWYKNCSTCKNYKTLLEENGYVVKTRDVKENQLTLKEIKEIYINSNYEIKKFFNTSGLVYKDLNLKDNLNKFSDEEKLELLSKYPMLIKRPILIDGDEILIARDINKIIK